MGQRFAPRLSAALPEGWLAKESITLYSPDGQANVIASSEPIGDQYDTLQYATVQGDLIRKDFTDFRELSFGEIQLSGGQRGYIRTFEWRPQGGELVTQVQTYYVESHRGYTATATALAAKFPLLEPTLRQVLEHLDIGKLS